MKIFNSKYKDISLLTKIYNINVTTCKPTCTMLEGNKANAESLKICEKPYLLSI